MVNAVNAIEDITWIYENGEFQISRWNRYMDNIFPGHKEIFINDMDETIQNGGFTFQRDFLPKLFFCKNLCKSHDLLVKTVRFVYNIIKKR